jgi:phage host-nuclease inhibitor protein Gam
MEPIDLEKYIYGEDKPDYTGFQVTDLSAADWAVRKAKAAEERMAQRQALADGYRYKIAEWLEQANKSDAETVAFMAGVLRPFVEEAVRGQKTKTVLIPSGKVGLRKAPDHIEIRDEAALMAILDAEHPECVRVKKEVNKAALKKVLQEGGNMEEAAIVEGEERLYIE